MEIEFLDLDMTFNITITKNGRKFKSIIILIYLEEILRERYIYNDLEDPEMYDHIYDVLSKKCDDYLRELASDLRFWDTGIYYDLSSYISEIMNEIAEKLNKSGSEFGKDEILSKLKYKIDSCECNFNGRKFTTNSAFL